MRSTSASTTIKPAKFSSFLIVSFTISCASFKASLLFSRSQSSRRTSLMASSASPGCIVPVLQRSQHLDFATSVSTSVLHPSISKSRGKPPQPSNSYINHPSPSAPFEKPKPPNLPHLKTLNTPTNLLYSPQNVFKLCELYLAT